MKDNEIKIRNISFRIALTIVILMVIVFLLDDVFTLNLYKYGLLPRSLEGLLGVFTSPFIHNTNDYSHIFNNATPIFVLSWLLFYTYRNIATRVFVYIYLITGVMVWIFGRPSFHIGMSGVIYGLTSFLIISGFIRKDLRSVSLSLLVIFLYGSLIWGVFPLDPKISWEGHFFGFLSGIIMAIVYRKFPPQPPKYMYELEEDIEEDIFPYWLEESNSYLEQEQNHKNKKQQVYINYTFIPKYSPQNSNTIISNSKVEEE